MSFIKFSDHAAKTVSLISIFALGLVFRTIGASAMLSCPIPLEKGTKWSYVANVAWTVSGTSRPAIAKIPWSTEIVDSFKGSNAQAAVVFGFPNELVGYEPGQSAHFSVLPAVSNRLYHLPTDGENAARSLARQLSANPSELPTSAEPFLESPLASGHKWGQEPGRNDNMYCWYVEGAGEVPPRCKAFLKNPPSKVVRVSYRTCPDHQLLDIVPELGIVRYVYRHHGTMASSDVRLVAFSTPGDSSNKKSATAWKQPHS
jgi:hypothetical protein